MIRLASFIAVIALLAAEASAQSNDPINQTYEFSYWTPGARNLAMGSATVACPDDATAASVNPAALVRLEGWNVMVEGRVWEQTSTFADGPSAATPDVNRDTDTAVSPTYLAFTRSFARFGVAVYGKKVTAARTRMRSYWLKTIGSLEMDIDAAGGAVAVDLGAGFSLGGSLAYNRLSLRSRTDEYDDYLSDGDIEWSNRQQSNDWDVGGMAALLWRPSDRWGVGATYELAPRFDVTLSVASSQYPAGVPPRGSVYQLPDVLAIGVALKPSASLLAAAEYRYIRFSQLTTGFRTIFYHFTEDPTRYAVRDGAQYHAGIEYHAKGMRSTFLRAGAWYEPAHGIEFDDRYPIYYYMARSLAAFRGGESQMHYSAGAGLDLGKGLRLDAAVELSDRLDVFSLSLLGKF